MRNPRMASQCFVILFLTTLPITSASDSPTQPDTTVAVEDRLLVGKWTALTYESGAMGRIPLQTQQLELEITKDGKAFWRQRGKIVSRERVRIDPTQRPAVLDIMTEGIRAWHRGIYELRGDKLTYVVAQPNRKRPRDFQLTGDLFDTKFTLERAK